MSQPLFFTRKHTVFPGIVHEGFWVTELQRSDGNGIGEQLTGRIDTASWTSDMIQSVIQCITGPVILNGGEEGEEQGNEEERFFFKPSLPHSWFCNSRSTHWRASSHWDNGMRASASLLLCHSLRPDNALWGKNKVRWRCSHTSPLSPVALSSNDRNSLSVKGCNPDFSTPVVYLRKGKRGKCPGRRAGGRWAAKKPHPLPAPALVPTLEIQVALARCFHLVHSEGLACLFAEG